MHSKEIAETLDPRFEIAAKDGAIVLKELNLPADATILDVGTGNGNFAIYLASQGYQVLTGEPSTDTSHYAGKDWARNAEKAGVRDRIRFETFDASEMPFASAAFDAVFFYGVLHHIDETARSAVLREALRIAKASGVIVFFEPRKKLLETLRTDDPGHCPAANPSLYLADRTVSERRMTGAFMDIFIYQKAA